MRYVQFEEGNKTSVRASLHRSTAFELVINPQTTHSIAQIMAALAAKFEDEAGVDYPKGVLHQQVLNGTYQFRIVGKLFPQYAVWFYVQADMMLHANAMLSVSKENKLSEMFECLDSLAKELGCRGVVFETKWKGMIRQCQRQGYQQSSIVMQKIFNKETA